jgi:hypothetical protein
VAASTNGWLRLAALVSAIVALVSGLKTIRDFLRDLEAGQLRWSLA